jgi:hypothetical protein
VVAGSGSTSPAYGIYAYKNPDGTIGGNRVRGVVKDGVGLALGIVVPGTVRVVLRNNTLIGDSSAGSKGIDCDASTDRAKDNTISGFAVGMESCSNDGGNVIKP